MRKTRLLISLTTCVALAATARAQPGDALRESYRLQNEGKLMAAWSVLQKALGAAADKASLYSTVSQFAPYVAETKLALAYDVLGHPSTQAAPPLPASHPLDGYKPEDAVEEISRLAESRQIVILNEAHYSSQCRVFGTALALKLRSRGYTLLAAETFSPEVYSYLEFGNLQKDAGYYTLDPFFADFARQALGAHFRLFSYDDHAGTNPQDDSYTRINKREIIEAENLERDCLKRYPNQKLLVYVGYSHANKNWGTTPDGRPLAWMAARLKKATGIDPLCIDQTSMSERAEPVYENTAYRYADSHRWLTRPTVFRNATGQCFVEDSYRDKVDVQVFHPRSQYVHGRPDWMRMDGYRREVPIEKAWRSAQPRLLEAFVESEVGNPIAMDRVIVRDGEEPPCLLLPRGHYRIVAQDEAGNESQLGRIEVRER